MSRFVYAGIAGGLLLVLLVVSPGSSAEEAWSRPVTDSAGAIVIETVMLEDEDQDPAAAGRRVAEALLAAMKGVAPKVVLVSESFEDEENKAALLEGIHAVIDPALVVGLSTYGSFTQAGCTDFDAVCLLGIGGEGIGVSAALVTEMGAARLSLEDQEALLAERLGAAGQALAERLARGAQDRLAVVLADAHSPKNRFLVEGMQRVLAPEFAITGGSANRNAGQTFVYFAGEMHEDAAVALMLSGDFAVSLAGRLAMDHEGIIRTAGEAAGEARRATVGEPFAVLAFNCAGRRGRVDRMEDELEAIQSALGRELPLFGCYCAGEVGPLDPAERVEGVFSGGSGWHVIFTVFSR